VHFELVAHLRRRQGAGEEELLAGLGDGDGERLDAAGEASLEIVGAALEAAARRGQLLLLA
jgi:hypothetical protein